MAKPPTNDVCRECKKSIEPGMTRCPRCVEDCELLSEDVTQCPPFLTAKDFDRFVRKLAVHAHANQDPDAQPLSIDQFEHSVAKSITNALPPFYVSILEYEPERQRQMGVEASYTIKANIPQELLYGTVERLKLWTRENPEEEEADDGGFTGA